MRAGWIWVGVLVCTVGLYGWKTYQRHEEDVAIENNRQVALRGNTTLIVPDLPMDSPERLRTFTDCEPDLLEEGYQTCHGEGELLGIPGYVDVERVNATTLHSVSYSLLLPAKAKVVAEISQRFGPPHVLDKRYAERGLCWALPQHQEIILEVDVTASDTNPTLTVMIDSQVAAQLLRWLEAIPGSCLQQPRFLGT